MSLYEQLLSTHGLTKDAILETVDEYMLYCFYLGFEPELRRSYNSPVRKTGDDEKPSWSMFQSKYNPCEYWWKDSGAGISGDIFELIRRIYNLDTIKEACKLIRDQEKIGFHPDQRIENGKITYQARPAIPRDVRIRITSQEFTKEAIQFWNSFGISKATLSYYNVTQVKYLWMNDDQEVPISPRTICFAYKEIDKYKIYMPYDKEFKFRNNYPSYFIEGFHQLKYQSSTLIITKSRKDVMLLYELGYESVSPKSENTVMPKQYFNYFNTRYNKIVVLFDNDMKHKGEDYPFDKVYVPIESGEKDLTDFYKRYGRESTISMLGLII